MAERGMEALPDVDSPIEKGALKRILNQTISTIEDNKTQIFDIYETARTEVETSKKLLEELRKQALQVIDKVDRLKAQEQQEKQKLVAVSSNFAKYSEEHIRACYESVANIQVELAVEREKEQRIREQRDKMELRLRHLNVMLHQSEHLALAIGSVLSYLSSQIQGVVWQIETVQKDKFVGARIIKAQEEERFRVSREIHDGPAQDMANLIMQTSICERLVDFDPDEAKRNLQDLRSQIRDCLKSIRQIIFDMRPMALDDLGLAPAIHQLVQKLGERGVISVEYETDGEPVPLPKHVEIAIFRVVQEALNNAAHHAGTGQARVRVLYTKTALSVLIEDKGKGFDPDAVKEESSTEDALGEDVPEQHFGMLGMQERAKLVGAELGITSAPGKGTKVHLRISLKPEDLAKADEAHKEKK